MRVKGGRKTGLAAAMALSLCAAGCGVPSVPAPYVHYGLRGGADSAGAHTASQGDTVYTVAQRYRLSMQDIIALNGLSPPYKLREGQRLTLPPPQTYTVKDGDTLYSISRTFNVSVTELTRQNRLRPPYKVSAGDTLRLPAGKRGGQGVYAHDPIPPALRPGTRPPPARSAAPAGRPVANDGPAMPSLIPAPVESERLTSRAVAAEPLAPPQPAVSPAVVEKITNQDIPRRTGGKFEWPVHGRVVASYGPQPGGLHNDGINIAAAEGAPVRSAENGSVVYADNQLQGFGNLVLIRHEGNWMTAYAHMGKTLVRKGDTVVRGQAIGSVGKTGSIDAPQLHFEVRRGTEAVNPKLFLENP